MINDHYIIITMSSQMNFIRFLGFLLIFIFISLLVKVYPIKLLFGKRAPTIVIGTETNEGLGDVTAKAPQEEPEGPEGSIQSSF